MAQIAVTKIHETGSESHSLLKELKALTDQIRERAFGIFQKRGSCDGEALDHWLEAERELTIGVESDLVEKDSEFQLSMAVPDFSAKDLKVSALPGALVVQGTLKDRLETARGGLTTVETGERMLFSRFELPVAIDVDQVTARLDNGILRVSAPKSMLDAATEKRAATREKAAAAKVAAA